MNALVAWVKPIDLIIMALKSSVSVSTLLEFWTVTLCSFQDLFLNAFLMMCTWRWSVLVSVDAWRDKRHQIPLKLAFRKLWAAQYAYWDSHSSPQGEQSTLSVTELSSLQPSPVRPQETTLRVKLPFLLIQPAQPPERSAASSVTSQPNGNLAEGFNRSVGWR